MELFLLVKTNDPALELYAKVPVSIISLGTINKFYSFA